MLHLTRPRKRGRKLLSLAVALAAAAPATAGAAVQAPAAADLPAAATQAQGLAAPTAASACGAPAVTDCIGMAGGMPDIPTLNLARPRNHTLIDGQQVTIAATGLYGQGGPGATALACFVGVGTGTPRFYRGDTRYISYSGSVYCPNGNSRGIVTMHITEVSLKDASNNAHLTNAPQYGPYVIERDGGTTGGQYTRTSDTQLQYLKIQAYLKITNGTSGSSNGWHVVPPACTKLNRFEVRCDFNSSAFGFLPSNAPAPDNVQPIIDAALAAGDSYADSGIDTLVNVGEPFTSIAGGLLDPQIIGANNQVQALLFGLPSPGAAFKVIKCAAAIAGFVAGNAILITKIRKLGGFVKVAKTIIRAKDTEAALKAIVAGAAVITGTGAVVSACG